MTASMLSAPMSASSAKHRSPVAKSASGSIHLGASAIGGAATDSGWGGHCACHANHVSLADRRRLKALINVRNAAQKHVWRAGVAAIASP